MNLFFVIYQHEYHTFDISQDPSRKQIGHSNQVICREWSLEQRDCLQRSGLSGIPPPLLPISLKGRGRNRQVKPGGDCHLTGTLQTRDTASLRQSYRKGTRRINVPASVSFLSLISQQSSPLAKPKQKPEEQGAIDTARRGQPRRAQSRVKEVWNGSGGETEDGQLPCLQDRVKDTALRSNQRPCSGCHLAIQQHSGSGIQFTLKPLPILSAKPCYTISGTRILGDTK